MKKNEETYYDKEWRNEWKEQRNKRTVKKEIYKVKNEEMC
jgi:hypothetical protein